MSKYRMVEAPTEKEITASGSEVTKESADRFTKRYIVWSTGAYWLDFEVHESDCAEGSGNEGVRLFDNGESDIMSMPTSETPTAASMLLSGFVKWDGCTQFRPRLDLWHYDDLEDIPDLRSILSQVWLIAGKNMENFDP